MFNVIAAPEDGWLDNFIASAEARGEDKNWGAYELAAEGDRPTLLFCIPAMRVWAEKFLVPATLVITPHRVEEITKNNKITEKAMMAVMSRGAPKDVPCILCRDVKPGSDQIIDGNHTYVAMGKLGALMGMENIGVRAYEFPAHVWPHFCVAKAT